MRYKVNKVKKNYWQVIDTSEKDPWTKIKAGVRTKKDATIICGEMNDRITNQNITFGQGNQLR